MRPALRILFAAILLWVEMPLLADQSLPQDAPAAAPQAFKPFTGKVARNKVRLRLQPNLDSTILREFNKGDLLIVTEDAGDFYAVKPPTDFKGYIFRTFVLDNVVEGNRVNIRLEPDLEATIIGQLSHGSHVDGAISPLNSKWLEIFLPADVHFYVSKEYVENIGDPHTFGTIQKRQNEVNTLLTQAQEAAQDELQKPFDKVNLDPVYIRLNKVINQFADFPEQVAKGKELLNQIQEAYLQKKIAYLESRTKDLQKTDETTPQMPVGEPTQQQTAAVEPGLTPKMAAWIPVEALFYEAWSKQHNNASFDNFYAQQRQEAVILTGMVEPYIRSLRHKPGDYVLVSKATHLPSAYLYSTKVDLQNKVGQEVTLIATPRPNYNFAFPAFFVLAAE